MSIYIAKCRLVVPQSSDPQATLRMMATSGEHEKLECYSGSKAVKNWGLTVQGSGAWVEGEISGTLETYDYKAIYEVYNVKDSKSSGWWIFRYTEDKSHDELKKVFEESVTTEVDYQLKFKIQGNDYGVNSVFITYEVIRLVYKGQTKDYICTPPASGGAVCEDGSEYPGGFEPVG